MLYLVLNQAVDEWEGTQRHGLRSPFKRYLIVADPIESTEQENQMQELLVDFITSLDGYASAEGWPGWWGLEGPEYLGWLDEQSDHHAALLMGATTYRVMSGFAAAAASGADEMTADEHDSVDELTRASKVVFSSTLQPPLS